MAMRRMIYPAPLGRHAERTGVELVLNCLVGVVLDEGAGGGVAEEIGRAGVRLRGDGGGGVKRAS
jgi:hypothetical protein